MDIMYDLPRKISFIKAGAQEPGGIGDRRQGVTDLVAEFIHVVWTSICEALLAARPNKLIWIEFRSISGKPMHFDPLMFLKEISDQASLVNRTSVPKQIHFPRQAAKHVAQELNHFHSGNVLREKLEMQTDPFANRRYRDCRDGRNSIASVAVLEDGSLAAQRPCPSHVGNDQKPAFVEEDQMRPTSHGVFLYVANLRVSNERSLFRRAEWRGVRASDNLTPSRSKSSRHGRDGSERHNVEKFVLPLVVTSTFRWRNRRSWLPSGSNDASDSSASPSNRADGQASVWELVARCRHGERLASIAPKNLSKLSVAWRQYDSHGRHSKAPPQSTVAFPVVEQCREVSCPKP
jgi:hypothetical protein